MTNCPQTPQEDTPEALGFEKQEMVAWFRPDILFKSAVKALLAGTFGKYADNREIQAASKLDDPPFVDLSTEKEIWFDYIADLGDGWNSTYTMARLLAAENLSVNKGDIRHHTQRGQFLIMGGDQVYPTASRQEYENRLIGPYSSALPWVAEEKNPPLLFAIPGNHDWYDGLVSFSRLFHHKRWIGGWRTKQTRSYFAIKLPHDWWVWGIDIQLGSEVDIAQINYFKDIAQNRMQNGSKLILCSAEPSWVYAELRGSKAYDNMAYIEKRIIEDQDQNYKHDFVVGLSGDLHTYARYTDVAGRGKQRFIAGGGGAYLYPTHDLPNRLSIPQLTNSSSPKTIEEYQIKADAVFPSKKQSRTLAAKCLLFPIKNWLFCLFAGVMYFFIAWLLQSTSRSFGENLIDASDAGSITNTIKTFLGSVTWVTEMIINSPGIFLFLFSILAGLCVFADSGKYELKRRKLSPSSLQSINVVAKTRACITRIVFGSMHFFLLSLTFVITFWLTAKILGSINLIGFDATVAFYAKIVIFMFSMIFIGGFFGGAVMGIYLWLSNILIGAHTNEVFSCQSIHDYKNFVRLHIDPNGKLTLYPIGVKTVCKDWELNKTAKDGKAWFEPKQGNIESFANLIETPIVIKK